MLVLLSWSFAPHPSHVSWFTDLAAADTHVLVMLLPPPSSYMEMCPFYDPQGC